MRFCFQGQFKQSYNSLEGKLFTGQYKGTIKWFNNAKGYGFVGRDDAPDLFVHYTSIKQDGYKSLREGGQIEFDVVQGAKGPEAASIRTS